MKGLAFETIPSSFELNVILEILNEEPFKNYPAWITFSSPDGLHTCSGELFSDLLRDSILPNFSKAIEPRYVGLNCVHPSCVVPFLDVVLKDYDEKVLNGVVVYPNNGGGWNSERRCWEDSDSVVGFCDEGENVENDLLPSAHASNPKSRLTLATRFARRQSCSLEGQDMGEGGGGVYWRVLQYG